jgi:hypothetical protein
MKIRNVLCLWIQEPCIGQVLCNGKNILKKVEKQGFLDLINILRKTFQSNHSHYMSLDSHVSR